MEILEARVGIYLTDKGTPRLMVRVIGAGEREVDKCSYNMLSRPEVIAGYLSEMGVIVGIQKVVSLLDHLQFTRGWEQFQPNQKEAVQ